jgi:hypothetical protein
LVAITVKRDDSPAAIIVGLAVIVTAGSGFKTVVTVTVAVAEVFPPAPFAAAV